MIGWLKTVVEGVKAVTTVIKAFSGGSRSKKPGPDVKPITPADLNKK